MFVEANNLIQKYPELSNNQPIDDKIKHIELYVTKIGEYQEIVYNFIIEKLREKMESDRIIFESGCFWLYIFRRTFISFKFCISIT